MACLLGIRQEIAMNNNKKMNDYKYMGEIHLKRSVIERIEEEDLVCTGQPASETGRQPASSN